MSASKDRELISGVTVYEGAKAYKPGSLEGALPEGFMKHAPDELKDRLLKVKVEKKKASSPVKTGSSEGNQTPAKDTAGDSGKEGG